MAERVNRRHRAMTEEEQAIIRDAYNVHRNNYVRMLAYVRCHIPANLREVYEGRRDVTLRRRIRDYVQRELEDAVQQREHEMRHAGPVAPWRAERGEIDQVPNLNAVADVPPPPPILATGNDNEDDANDAQHDPDQPPPEPDAPARRREPLGAQERRNQERFSDMLDAHQVRMERVDRFLDAIEQNV